MYIIIVIDYKEIEGKYIVILFIMLYDYFGLDLLDIMDYEYVEKYLVFYVWYLL